MTVAYLVACILGIVTALMIVRVRERLKRAEAELGMLAIANAIIAMVLLIDVTFDFLCQLRTGAGLIKGCLMASVYMVVAAVEWIFCGLAVLYVKILKKENTREE